MPTVDLFTFQTPPLNSAWALGETYKIPGSPSQLTDFVTAYLKGSKAGFLLFWDLDLGSPKPELIEGLTLQPVDLWHAGLLLGMQGLPRMIDAIKPGWMLNCDPAPDLEASSWRLSLRACLVRTEVLRRLCFLRPDFQTLDAAALEWGHRCIQRGAILRHSPSLLPSNLVNPSIQLPYEDELRFALLRFGRKWALWGLGRSVLTRRVGLREALVAWQHLPASRPSEPPSFQQEASTLGIENPPTITSVSVIVPTLDRYPYLDTLLRQLGCQTVPPLEIIVIDQSGQGRPPGFYEHFTDLPLRLLIQEQPGQCSSRNAGLALAKGEYILFLDDDDEVPPDLIKSHLASLDRFGADVSSGVADVPEEGCLPEAFSLTRVSDVFPTNNTLLRRSALQRSGLFDLAYDHGARADGDLGMRLHLSGARMVLNPSIRVLHHHAPRGGLRTHKARVVTYASSRRSLFQRDLPSVSEIYLMLRYFTHAQVQEGFWISLLGTFSLHEGSLSRRILKGLVSAVLLPASLLTLARRRKQAMKMLQGFPQIPVFE